MAIWRDLSTERRLSSEGSTGWRGWMLLEEPLIAALIHPVWCPLIQSQYLCSASLWNFMLFRGGSKCCCIILQRLAMKALPVSPGKHQPHVALPTGEKIKLTLWSNNETAIAVNQNSQRIYGSRKLPSLNMTESSNWCLKNTQSCFKFLLDLCLERFLWQKLTRLS